MKMEGMVKKFSALDISKDSERTEISKLMKEILYFLDEADDISDADIEPSVQEEVMKKLVAVLTSEHHDMYADAAKMVAEIAKQEEARVPCVESNLVSVLLQCLKQQHIPSLIQVCRALGNICFDNDQARSAVDTEGGIASLVRVLREYAECKEEGADRLRVVACGFLLNLTNSNVRRPSIDLQHPINFQKIQPNSPSDAMRMVTLQLKFDRSLSRETVQDKAILQGAVEVLNLYLQKHSDDENVCQMALLALGCLVESELGKSKLSECEVAITVGELLGSEAGDELQDLVFEQLAAMAETDAVKMQLVGSSVIDKILDLIQSSEKTADEDSLNTIRMATEIFPTLLHADTSLEVLFKSGQGRLYKESLQWLKSPHEQLQVAGALTLGNFAIKDTNCVFLVSEGVHDIMLQVLDVTESHGDKNPGLQHAVFSSLRNLSIPAKNKESLFKAGVVERILPYAFASKVSPVQFKLLGTFRMLVDGQEATASFLGCNAEFIKQIIQWCTTEEHPGVKAEAIRLISWLVKHSRDPVVMETVVSHGATPELCHMMHSEHAVMQNEALVAFTFIATSILDKVVQNFVEHEVIPAIKVLLTDKETLNEIMSNCLTLVLCLSKSDELKQMMNLADFPSVFSDLHDNSEDDSVKQLLTTAQSALKL